MRLTVIATCLLPALVWAQVPPAQPEPAPAASPRSEIALAPSRFELPMKPGESRTVVVTAVSSGASDAEVRLLTSLGDWSMNARGQVQFDRPGTNPRSAADWIIYTPVEFTVKGGQTFPIRVTIDVPEDAAPGDHTAALFVEERPPDIKAQSNEKRIRFHFRLAAIIYLMVEPTSLRGELVSLEVNTEPGGAVVVPGLKNGGNTHLRPSHSYEVFDKEEKVVAALAPVDSFPVLAGQTALPELRVESPLAPGEYSVRYRVDFKDGTQKIVEGRKAFVVPVPQAQKPKPAAKPKTKEKK